MADESRLLAAAKALLEAREDQMITCVQLEELAAALKEASGIVDQHATDFSSPTT